MGKCHQSVTVSDGPLDLFCLLQGLGTDEDTLIEILASRNNREILDMKKAYQEGSVTNSLHYHSALRYHSFS